MADTSITARKSLSVQGAFSITGTMYAPPPWIGGITAGLIHSTNVAKLNIISTAAAATSEIEFGDTISGGLVKLQATPSDGGSDATKF